MERFFLPIFLLVEGLTLCGVVLPYWARIIGGICAIIAAVLALF